MITIPKSIKRLSLKQYNLLNKHIVYGINKRGASTVANEGDIAFWPSNSQPTPYEVLGLNSTQCKDKKLLKKKYRELSKIYHPDLSGMRRILDHKGKELNSKAKESRFKQINSAYMLLNDPQKKSLYDRFQTGWEFTSNINARYSNSAFHASAHARRYNTHDDRFWHAGNWEDYADMSSDKSKSNGPIFNSELARKNRDVALLCLGLALLVMSLQIIYALDRYQEEIILAKATNDTANNNLLFAYLNHGLGLDKWSRLNHFLWNRRYNMYSHDQELMAQQEASDKELIRVLKEKEKASVEVESVE